MGHLVTEVLQQWDLGVLRQAELDLLPLKQATVSLMVLQVPWPLEEQLLVVQRSLL
jgi:hypothetical protein